MDENELERLEFETQHEATWQTLQAATGQRDLVVKLHGGLVAVLSVSLPSLAAAKLHREDVASLVLGFLSVGTLVLAAATHSFLRGVQSLRMLQFQMYSASRYSRWVLGQRQEQATYFSNLLDTPEVRPLRRQLDPMGLTVANVRQYFVADAVLAPACAFAAAAVQADGAARVALGIAAVVLGAVAGAVARRQTDLHIRRHEESTSRAVVRRYRELGVIPPE
jgi:hypothetical protein